MALARLVDACGLGLELDDQGLIVIHTAIGPSLTLGALHGSGTFGLSQLEQTVDTRLRRLPEHRKPRWYLIAGARPGPSSLPSSIVRPVAATNIVRGRGIVRHMSVEEIVDADPVRLQEIIRSLRE